MYHLVKSVSSPKNLYMIVNEKKKDEANKWPSFIPMLCACLPSLQYENLIENVSTIVSTKVN